VKASNKSARSLIGLQQGLRRTESAHEKADDPELGSDVPKLAIALEW
jgi:hypothetical protein